MSPLTVPVLQAMLTACHPPPTVTWDRIAAHARVESGYVATAIGDNTAKRPFFPATIQDAAALARQLIAARHNIDAGVMQINLANWGWLGLTPERVFDPQTNVCAAAIVLAQAYDAERNVSCRYNTGRPDCANGYPEKIAAMRAELLRGDYPASSVPPVTKPAVPSTTLSAQITSFSR